MIDSKLVLWGQTVGYTAYVLAVMAGMAWFVYKVTRDGSSKQIPNAAFYSVVAILVAVGVSLHIVTHETIPWKKIDLNRANIAADKTFEIDADERSHKGLQARPSFDRAWSLV